MASILNFPSNLFAESPVVPIRTSPSAEEAALNRPRPRLHLVNLMPRPATSFDPGHERDKVVARIDVELARRSNSSRLRRLFTLSDSTSNWPLDAA